MLPCKKVLKKVFFERYNNLILKHFLQCVCVSLRVDIKIQKRMAKIRKTTKTRRLVGKSTFWTGNQTLFSTNHFPFIPYTPKSWLCMVKMMRRTLKIGDALLSNTNDKGGTWAVVNDESSIHQSAHCTLTLRDDDQCACAVWFPFPVLTCKDDFWKTTKNQNQQSNCQQNFES